jgi:hypothetical protein
MLDVDPQKDFPSLSSLCSLCLLAAKLRNPFMAALTDQIEPLKQAALADLKAAPDLAALEQIKGAWIGAHGKFTALMKQLGTLPKEEKPAAGKAVNAAKIELEAALAERRAQLELEAALPTEPTDFTLPGRRRTLGRLHPLTQVTEDIVRSFRKIGFAVADGPEVEDEYHCFDALNTPADHPARDTQDTFYLAQADNAPRSTLHAPLLLDWSPMVEAILADLKRRVPIAQISARFHNALAEAIVAVAKQVGQPRVVLSGGCFQNRYLTERSVQRLQEEGFRPYWHQRVPPNDGGISLGQVVAALRQTPVRNG